MSQPALSAAEAGSRGPSSAWPLNSLRCLDRFVAALAGPNPDAIIHREHKDFAIANFACLASPAALQDGTDGRFDKIIIHRDFETDFAQQVDRDIVATKGLGVSFLATKALYIHERKADDLDLGERCFDRFQAARLNNGND